MVESYRKCRCRKPLRKGLGGAKSRCSEWAIYVRSGTGAREPDFPDRLDVSFT